MIECIKDLWNAWLERQKPASKLRKEIQNLKRSRASVEYENRDLRKALADVRHEICLGPVNDVLWHHRSPAETSVDRITAVLCDGWTYDDWVEKYAPDSWTGNAPHRQQDAPPPFKPMYTKPTNPPQPGSAEVQEVSMVAQRIPPAPAEYTKVHVTAEEPVLTRWCGYCRKRVPMPAECAYTDCPLCE